jgi:hypothetical protein
MNKADQKTGIRIRQVLDLIYSGYDDFEITFIKTNGKEKSFKKARLGVPPSEKRLAKMQGIANESPSKKDWSHHVNKSHNLLLFDVEKNRPFELKICLLTSFNGMKIIWHVPKK